MKRLSLISFLIALLCGPWATAQDNVIYQTVRGRVTSADPDNEVVNASVTLVGTDPIIGTYTDDANRFSLQVPVGRQTVRVQSVGFQTYETNILVHSGREVVLNIVLEPAAVALSTVEVVAPYDKSRPLNKLSFSGARTFSTDETYRFAGSLGDPARMVRAFPGIIPVNDNRNDIIIRGNSSIGVQWILDGIEIGNPNHFNAGVGMTGGQVTYLNTNFLDNSDFHLSAWPAPYGNALAGIFDLSMRKGNSQKRQFWAQMGFNGVEVGAEGYISQKMPSSYLVSYRYSIPDLMNKLGVKMSIVPRYQDVTAKLDFQLSDQHSLSLLGIWGWSKIQFQDADLEDYAEFDDDLFTYEQRVMVKSISHVLGLTHKANLSPKTSWRNVLSFVRSNTQMPVDTINKMNREEGWQIVWHEFSKENKYSLYSDLEHRFSYRNAIVAGVKYDHYQFDYLEKMRGENGKRERIVTNEQGNFGLLRGYAQYKHDLTPRWSITGGLFGMYTTLNGSHSLEPRGGLRFRPSASHTIALAGGMYSQLQPRTFYFIQTETPNGIEYTNKNLDFSRGAQLDLSYDWAFAPNWHTKLEAYYQHLYNIPVINDPNEVWTMLEAGGAGTNVILRNDNLINKGTGRNYGVEWTLERFFSNHFYLLFNTSLYSSTFTNGFTSDRYSTVFDGRYMVNLATGYEKPLRKGWTLFGDLRGSLAGGTRYTPVLVEESLQKGELVYDNSQKNSLKTRDYFRLDLRLGFRLDRKHISEEMAFDLQNLTNHKNVAGVTYNLHQRKYSDIVLMSFAPMVTYRVFFSLR